MPTAYARTDSPQPERSDYANRQHRTGRSQIREFVTSRAASKAVEKCSPLRNRLTAIPLFRLTAHIFADHRGRSPASGLDRSTGNGRNRQVLAEGGSLQVVARAG